MLFRLYLDKYATKADVFAIERSTGIDLPLWMKQLPKTTGEIQDRWAEGSPDWSTFRIHKFS